MPLLKNNFPNLKIACYQNARSGNTSEKRKTFEKKNLKQFCFYIRVK